MRGDAFFRAARKVHRRWRWMSRVCSLVGHRWFPARVGHEVCYRCDRCGLFDL